VGHSEVDSTIARTATIHDVSSTDALIEIDRVSFGYDASRLILQDISLRFARGQGLHQLVALFSRSRAHVASLLVTRGVLASALGGMAKQAATKVGGENIPMPQAQVNRPQVQGLPQFNSNQMLLALAKSRAGRNAPPLAGLLGGF
jgi:hypothetical protein